MPILSSEANVYSLLKYLLSVYGSSGYKYSLDESVYKFTSSCNCVSRDGVHFRCLETTANQFNWATSGSAHQPLYQHPENSTGSSHIEKYFWNSFPTSRTFDMCWNLLWWLVIIWSIILARPSFHVEKGWLAAAKKDSCHIPKYKSSCFKKRFFRNL